jgi:dipeptidyl aminopeptidase/acylaminoacyl peptidase
VKALIFTHLLYRRWNAYKEGKRTHLLIISAANVAPPVGATNLNYIEALPRDLTPGDYDAPVFSLGGQDDFAFSPDGQEICYASNHDPEPAISTNSDLFTVRVNFWLDNTSDDVLAATKDITAENKAADNTPLYSPDGKYIAYRAQQRPGYESDRWRLMLYDRQTGEKTNAAEGFDRWVGSFRWFGSDFVVFTSEDSGQSPIYMLALGEDCKVCRPVEILDGYNDDLFTVESRKQSADLITINDALVFSRMSTESPTELFVADLADCRGDKRVEAIMSGEAPGPLPCTLFKARQLSHANNSILSQVSMSPLEPFWFTGAHGDKVQGWLIKPPNFDRSNRYPVKFLIHGGPEVPFGDEWSYRWNFELFAANGYVVVFINFHGSPGYGQKFIDAINGDWGGAPFEDLMKGLDYAEQHYAFVDKDRECVLGASYGGYMANWILGHTNRFKCIVTHDGMFNTESAYGDTEELWFPEWEFKGTPGTNREMYRKWSPHLSATNFKTPTLVVHGHLDYRLDVSQGFDLFTTLQRQGVPSKMLYFPDEGHWYSSRKIPSSGTRR